MSVNIPSIVTHESMCFSVGFHLWVPDHNSPAESGLEQRWELSASLCCPALWLERCCMFLLMEALAAVLLLGRHLSNQTYVCVSQK